MPFVAGKPTMLQVPMPEDHCKTKTLRKPWEKTPLYCFVTSSIPLDPGSVLSPRENDSSAGLGLKRAEFGFRLSSWSRGTELSFGFSFRIDEIPTLTSGVNF